MTTREWQPSPAGAHARRAERRRARRHAVEAFLRRGLRRGLHIGWLGLANMGAGFTPMDARSFLAFTEFQQERARRARRVAHRPADRLRDPLTLAERSAFAALDDAFYAASCPAADIPHQERTP